jgi:hypothetical protein
LYVVKKDSRGFGAAAIIEPVPKYFVISGVQNLVYQQPHFPTGKIQDVHRDMRRPRE